MLTIRASLLPSYPDCPRRAAVSLIGASIKDKGYDLRSTLPSIGGAVGTGVHAAAKMCMDAKMAGNETNVADAVEMAILSYKHEVGDGVLTDDTTPNNGDAEKQISVLTRSFFVDVAPIVRPAFVENHRDAVLDDNTMTSGHPDVETADNSIEDWKFGSQLRPYHAQLGDYSLLRRANGLPAPARLTLHHLPRVPVRKPYPGASRIDYDVGQCERAAWSTLQHIRRDMRNWLDIGEPWVFSANLSSTICSEKYCPAYGTAWCELSGKRGRVIQASETYDQHVDKMAEESKEYHGE